MSKNAATAKKLLSVARAVSPKHARFAERLMAANGLTPIDLAVRTRESMVETQREAILAQLGAYQAAGVSISTMKRMREHPQIRLALAATKAPILDAAIWFDTTSRELGALAEAVFLDSGLLRELQRTSLQAIDFGYAAHEKIWEIAPEYEVSWPAAGKTVGVTEQKTKNYKQLVLPKRLKDLDPAKVRLLQDPYGSFEGLLFGSHQGAMTNAELVKSIRDNKENALPPEKCFVFSLNNEWQNPYGVSRMVSAYDPWYWQKIIYLICNRWYEMKSAPPLVGRAPSAPHFTDPGVDANELDESEETMAPVLKMNRLLDGLRSLSRITIPSEPFRDDQGKPSAIRAWDITELGQTDVHPAYLAYLAHLDIKITRALLMPDGAIAASENSGTYGSTRALSDVAVKIQNETLTKWVRDFNAYVLKPWLDYNGIKDRLVLRTSGISSDNRDMMLAVTLKTLEADMLSDQAWGPTSPEAMTRLISRRKLLRGVGVPFDEPDPNAPIPKMPPLPPQLDPAQKAAKGNASKTKSAKTKTGLSTGFRGGLDTSTPEFDAWARDTARSFESDLSRNTAATPYASTLTTHEKAVAAILIWLLLRADKKDAKGKKIKGLTKADGLVLRGNGSFVPAEKLAAALGDLDAMVSQFEGRGYSLDPTGSKPLLAKAQKGFKDVLSDLPDAVSGAHDPAEYLQLAIDSATAAMKSMVDRFDGGNASDFEELDSEDETRIAELNARGLLWNIENIAIRNGRNLAEKAMNSFGHKRTLSIVSDAMNFKFNKNYSDLSVEAHYRAAIRATLVGLAEKNDYPFLMMVSGSLYPDDPYVGSVRSIDDWSVIASRRGDDDAVRQFGFHPGSASYWFPVPESERIRKPDMLAVERAKAYLAAIRTSEKEHRPTGS